MEDTGRIAYGREQAVCVQDLTGVGAGADLVRAMASKQGFIPEKTNNRCAVVDSEPSVKTAQI